MWSPESLSRAGVPAWGGPRTLLIGSRLAAVGPGTTPRRRARVVRAAGQGGHSGEEEGGQDLGPVRSGRDRVLPGRGARDAGFAESSRSAWVGQREPEPSAHLPPPCPTLTGSGVGRGVGAWETGLGAPLPCPYSVLFSPVMDFSAGCLPLTPRLHVLQTSWCWCPSDQPWGGRTQEAQRSPEAPQGSQPGPHRAGREQRTWTLRSPVWKVFSP